jgi:hypothetical protein
MCNERDEVKVEIHIVTKAIRMQQRSSNTLPSILTWKVHDQETDIPK